MIRIATGSINVHREYTKGYLPQNADEWQHGHVCDDNDIDTDDDDDEYVVGDDDDDDDKNDSDCDHVNSATTAAAADHDGH